MTAMISNMRLVDHSTVSKQLDLASEIFHRINRIIPQEQLVLKVPPDCCARDALARMKEHGYSQVPVINEDGEVLGVFSYRSFAQRASGTLDQWKSNKCAPGDQRVDDFLEQFDFARVTAEMKSIFDAINRDNGVLIGSPKRLIGILTPMDFLRYFDRVASPFVMVSEIELSLRALLRLALGTELIVAAANRALKNKYGVDRVPTDLEDMTFDDYRAMICCGDNWGRFEPIFGGARALVDGNLKRMGEIRNDLFHFRREITLLDHQALTERRDWLLNKIKLLETRRRRESQP